MQVEAASPGKVHRVERIQLHESEGHFHAAELHEIGEDIRHAEKAGSGVEDEPLLLEAVEPSAGAAVLLKELHLIPPALQ
ncbi:hypothetical protein SDC9_134849 [bioreactor metagenome]|uniref:Uncharacterized protein n=1 Tax=bioreactor metagenome TaxID=1076179 RepID=A0A645DES3_9ZZZZ